MAWKLLSILGCALAHAAVGTPDTIHVVVKVPFTTPAHAPIYLTGNTSELCQWQANCLRLQETGGGVYEAEIERPGQALEFKVTRGSWAQEASDSYGQAPANFRVSSDAKEIVLSVVNWKDLPPFGVSGHIDTYQSFYSPQLGNARAVRIWLPPSYENSPQRRYPVLYLHDGQNLFDPRTSTIGVEWNIDEQLGSMMRARAVPDAIVVGIDSNPSGEERFNEYDYNEKGARYADFLIHTVKPFVDSTYRTRPDREHTFTMGSSMGAYISFALVWAHPEVFSRAAGLSLPAHLQSRSPFRFLEEYPAPRLPVSIYQDYGDFGGDALYPEPAQEFGRAVAQKMLGRTHYELHAFPYADHSEADWSRRAQIPLRFVLAPARR
jgi:predicted alpha/beta superfamily hydrolase